MLFNSYIFVFLFLPITVSVYFLLNRLSLYDKSIYWLIASSIYFYAWWNYIYLPLILFSIFFNYFISKRISHYGSKNKSSTKKRKALFLVALIVNIGILGYFKYIDFFIDNINILFGKNIHHLNLMLPLAISFFTLQQIAYIVDVYEGLVKDVKLRYYFLFVMFFPQLIAGPIVHHKDMMPQFSDNDRKRLNDNNISKAIFIFCIGLFKKVILADTLAFWANAGFENSASLNFIEAWATALSYTFQIYFDFSGYMDMATGAALLFNIELPKNFNSPYKATGVIDYWSRWHITLTNFIMTYIYTPILRSCKKITFNKAMLATLFSMLLSGIWHGASWIYIFWGGVHGLGLIVNHYWRKTKIKLHKHIARIITFIFIILTMVIFRSSNWTQLTNIISTMFNPSNIILPVPMENTLYFLEKVGMEFGPWMQNLYGGIETWVFLLVSVIIVFFFENSHTWLDRNDGSLKYLFISAFLFSISLFGMREVNEFIYFNF